MTSLARDLADWADQLTPTPDDLTLADLALVDTTAVAVAARNHPVVHLAADQPEAALWAVAGHVLDFDDLHMQSTAHISVVCVPAVLATGGDARAYLAAAGVMARLGTALGWAHYSAGWHTTCTAGAPAAAVGAGIALGLNANQLATAMALAVPAAGGVQRAFGTDAKSLQVGFAVAAGVRAARLAAAGATADLSAVDEWFTLVHGDPLAVHKDGPAVPGGLAIKLYPCCYALQRPISAIADLASTVDPASVTRVVLHTPQATLTPLIHHRPKTGLQGKFSLEYAAAAAILDAHPGFASFTDEAVRRPEARRLVDIVEVRPSPGGDWLLAGDLNVEIHAGNDVMRGRLRFPPGSPGRPPTADELADKLNDCLTGTDLDARSITWASAAAILRR